MNPQTQTEQLQIENQVLKNQIQELTDKLKKYTSPSRNKRFYQNHKEEVKQKNKEYREKTNYKPDKEKMKLYNKLYYERKKKEKLEPKLNNDINT